MIISTIQSQPGHHDVAPDTLIALNAWGVSGKVLSAMASKGSEAAAASPSAGADRYDDLGVGVYHKVKVTG